MEDKEEDASAAWIVPQELVSLVNDTFPRNSLYCCTLSKTPLYNADNVENKVEEWKATIDESWKSVLDSIRSKDFKKLVADVENERLKMQRIVVYPPPHDVFSWTRYCRFQDIKVVIVGQDPYPQPGKAHGLAFSDKQGWKAPWPKDSLNVIFEALENDGYYRTNRNLSDLARQGVLLLNTVLTVRDGEPNSHARIGWEAVTSEVIRVISTELKHSVVFLLWGKKAMEMSKIIQNKLTEIDTCKVESYLYPGKTNFDIHKSMLDDASISYDDGRHIVLTAVHLSPLANKDLLSLRDVELVPIHPGTPHCNLAAPITSLPGTLRFEFCSHFRLTNYWFQKQREKKLSGEFSILKSQQQHML